MTGWCKEGRMKFALNVLQFSKFPYELENLFFNKCIRIFLSTAFLSLDSYETCKYVLIKVKTVVYNYRRNTLNLKFILRAISSMNGKKAVQFLSFPKKLFSLISSAEKGKYFFPIGIN